MCTTLGISWLNLESRSTPLSSNNFPKLISRIELGLAGFASHSSLHSRNINSFNLYTLRLKGSLFGTETDRLARYLLSSLNGCRAPLVNSRVIRSVGPAASLAASLEGGIGSSASEEGPIAVDCNLESCGTEDWERSDENGADESCVVMSCVVSGVTAGVKCVSCGCDVSGGGAASGFAVKLLISNGVDEGASSALSPRFVMSRGTVRVSSGAVSAASFEAMIEGATTAAIRDSESSTPKRGP